MQYNAIVDQATISGSNIYGALWTGPPATTFQAENQTVSLMGLISSLYLGNDTAISTSPRSFTSSSKVAPVAGGVVGGVAFAAILATAALILYKRKKRQQASNLHDAPVPFMAQTSSATQQPHVATISLETTNERLQVRTWDMDEEMPPEYPSNE